MTCITNYWHILHIKVIHIRYFFEKLRRRWWLGVSVIIWTWNLCETQLYFQMKWHGIYTNQESFWKLKRILGVTFAFSGQFCIEYYKLEKCKLNNIYYYGNKQRNKFHTQFKWTDSKFPIKLFYKCLIYTKLSKYEK